MIQRIISKLGEIEGTEYSTPANPEAPRNLRIQIFHQRLHTVKRTTEISALLHIFQDGIGQSVGL